MKAQSALSIALVAFLPGACTITGPADDGFANSQESVSIGRLFSDDDEGYTLFRSRKDEANPGGSVETLPETGGETEFRAFQEWSRARRDNTPDYQKFRLWQEFESFQRWREQQPSD